MNGLTNNPNQPINKDSIEGFGPHLGGIMTAQSHNNGHPIISLDGVTWVYADDYTSIAIKRPCAKCGGEQTKEGHDSCLGRITGVISACCGHGIPDDEIEILSGPEQCKRAGFVGGLIRLAEIVEVNYVTFRRWPETRPKLFKAALLLGLHEQGDSPKEEK